PPLLLIDNADRASASVMSLVNWLAALQAGEAYALRLVLTGRESMADFARSDSLRNIARRRPTIWSMNPLTAYEAEQYLRTRFAAAGGRRAEEKFTAEVCARLYELSAGWPGELNRQARVALERSEELRSAALPRLIVTRDGETVGAFELTQKKYVIGRSELADIVIEDSYTSKLHAMLQVYSNAVLLSDLNSTNGTRVNSKEVRNTILRNNDVILLGRHRLKIENAPTLSTDVQQRLDVADTVTMQSLADLRRARARRNLAAIRHGHAG
ncbi:MAG: FHA domain-containing protein, partial [Woeseiaceae bacterium]|nr:FHA domain-containing protein [Woeseiaceae bacterium]